MSNFDWGVVAKGLISTTTYSQPIAVRAVGSCSRSFLYLTKQEGYADIQNKTTYVHGMWEIIDICKHTCTRADYFTSPPKETRGSLALDGDLLLWHQTSCCFILRWWTCEPSLLSLYLQVVNGKLYFFFFYPHAIQSSGMKTMLQAQRRRQSHWCGIMW